MPDPFPNVNNLNTNFAIYIQPNTNTKISYDKISQPVGYNAKKQGFSIGEDFRDA